MMGHTEFLKLWKGFFYCFWLSDKPEGQHKLAEIISKFVHELSVDNKEFFAESSAFLFLRTFWETMGREWAGLDHFRLNKYYYFMGRVLFESFNMIIQKSESNEMMEQLVKTHNAILESVVFDFKNPAFPISIQSYVVENYFGTVKSVFEGPLSAEMTILVCDPIIQAVAYCNNKVFFTQFSETLVQGVLPGEEEEEDDGEMSEDEEQEDDVDEEALQDDDEKDSASEEEEDEKEALTEESEQEIIDDEEIDSDLEVIDEDMTEDEEDGEQGEFFFDYSKLSKHLMDVGGREDINVRNRTFLYDFSKIIEEVESGEFAQEQCVDECCGEACHDEECAEYGSEEECCNSEDESEEDCCDSEDD